MMRQIFQISFLQLDSNLWIKYSENRNNMIVTCCSGPNYWCKQLTLCCTYSTNFLLVLKPLNQWSTLVPCNSDVIVRYYINIAPVPLLCSVDMFPTQKGETGRDKHCNWNVRRVTGLSEKWDVSLGDMNKLYLLCILQNWQLLIFLSQIQDFFFSEAVVLNVWGFLLFFIYNTKVVFLVKVKNQTTQPKNFKNFSLQRVFLIAL